MALKQEKTADLEGVLLQFIDKIPQIDLADKMVLVAR